MPPKAYENRIIIPYYLNGEMIGFNSRYIGIIPKPSCIILPEQAKFEHFLFK